MIKFSVAFLGIIAAALSAYYILGLYPVVLVQGEVINHRNFEKSLSASKNYYLNAQGTYGREQASILGSAEFENELKRSVLEKMIENALINFQPVDQTEVERRVSGLIKDKNLDQAATALYGLSFDDLKAQLLVPEAKKEIIMEQYGPGWLEEAKKQANIKVFLGGFDWDGQRVILEK